MRVRSVPPLTVVLILVVAGLLTLSVSSTGPLRILAQEPAAPSPEMVERGQQAAQEFGCLTCHTTTGARLVGPTFLGLFGSTVQLTEGTAVADETYIRGQIVAGHSRTVIDYPSDIMPDYGGLIPDEDVDALVAWIVSLGEETQAQMAQTGTPQPGTTPQPGATPATPPFLLAEGDEEIARQLWQFLQEANYEDMWSTIPGKGTLYAGQDPHGALLSTYMNPPAAQALVELPGLMPHGSIIVKENYTADGTLAAVSVAVKSDGYNPDHNDWYWASFAPDGELDVAGPVPGCISCHGAVWSNDYIFSFPVAPIDPSQPRPRTVDEAGVTPMVPGAPTTPTMTPEPEAAEPTPVPMADVTPAVDVEDQPIVANSVVIAEVMSQGPGWLVIHADSDGSPGPVIGFAPVNPGRNPDVVVEIDPEGVTQTLHAMLHQDTGEIGFYEFPGGDPPVQVEGQTVNVPFAVTEAEEPTGPTPMAPASPTAPAATPEMTASPTAPAATPEMEVSPTAPAATPMATASPMAPEATPEDSEDLAAAGMQLAQQMGCFACHSTDGTRLLGPTFQGLYGSTVTLADGSTVEADEEYIHRSITDPNAQIVQGFPSGLMPNNYDEQLDEEQIDSLVAFIRSLGSGE